MIWYLCFADDLALPACSPEELQQQLNALLSYCNENNLVNTQKTKVMIYHKGRLPKHDASFQFMYNNQPIERVSNFCYLGFTFTTQLSFSTHVDNIVAKASSRLCVIYQQLNFYDLNIDVCLQIFFVYVFPIFLYGLPLWLSNCSQSALHSVDAVFTKFLKKYLGIPTHANIAITYFLTGTAPLSHQLQTLASTNRSGLVFPSELGGLQLKFLLKHTPTIEYCPIPSIPSTFWHSKIFWCLPTRYHARRTLCRDVTDQNHYTYCSQKKFHVQPDEYCVCTYCGNNATSYHQYFCNVLPTLS